MVGAESKPVTSDGCHSVTGIDLAPLQEVGGSNPAESIFPGLCGTTSGWQKTAASCVWR